MAVTALETVMARDQTALDEFYGPRRDGVIQFGSRARGDARPDSDDDVAVFLPDMPDRWSEPDRLARLSPLAEARQFADLMTRLIEHGQAT